MLDVNALPDDVCTLKRLLLEHHQQLAAKDHQLRERDQQIEWLKFQIAKLRRWRFGSSSERLEGQIAQLSLTLEALEQQVALERKLATVAPVTAERMASTEPQPPRRRAPRQQLPEHFPRQDKVVPLEACACPQCGGTLRKLAGDEAEVLEVVPVQFTVTRYIRQKRTCCRCAHIVQAPAPSRPIAKSYAGASLLALVLVWKYGFHLPLYRQVQIFAHAGLSLRRSTLAQWVAQLAELLTPLAEAIVRHVLAGGGVHADDTPLRVLAPGAGKAKKGRLWTYVRDERPWRSRAPPAVFYRYSSDWRGEHPKRHLRGYRGRLHADDYAGFNALYARERPDAPARIEEVSCWMHVRRKLFEVYETLNSALAAEGLAMIGQLYAIEARVRGETPAARVAARQRYARPLLATLHGWLERQVTAVEPGGALSKALRYPLKHWEALTRYVGDGTLEIDNGAAERSIRGIAVGRRNYLFAGSDAGGERAALAYTLIESARMNGLDPHAYLQYVIERVAEHPINRIEELLPWNVAPILEAKRAAKENAAAAAA